MRTLPTDKVWKTYGKREPYYGVFGIDPYLSENMTGEVTREFFASGEEYVRDLFSIIHKKIDPDFKPENILDYGCGPGRMIIPFSKYTKQVTGMDVSEDYLKEAALNCSGAGVGNVSLLVSDDKLESLKGEKFDLVHSFIVLQHLDTKRGEKMIRSLVAAVRNGGVGVLHVTYFDNYPKRTIVNFFRFRLPFLARLLRLISFGIRRKKFDNLPQMQMNNYNLNRVFAILQHSSVNGLYIEFTDHHNYWGVKMYFKNELLTHIAG